MNDIQILFIEQYIDLQMNTKITAYSNMDDHVFDRGHFSMWSKMVARRNKRDNFISHHAMRLSWQLTTDSQAWAWPNNGRTSHFSNAMGLSWQQIHHRPV